MTWVGKLAGHDNSRSSAQRSSAQQSSAAAPSSQPGPATAAPAATHRCRSSRSAVTTMRPACGLRGEGGDRVVAGAIRRDHAHRAGGWLGRRRTRGAFDDQDDVRQPPHPGPPVRRRDLAVPRAARHRAGRPRAGAGIRSVRQLRDARVTSGASSSRSRTAAPARSRHQPSGREPTTFAPSTMIVTGESSRRSSAQCAARPGCRSSRRYLGTGTQATSSVSSSSDSTANGFSRLGEHGRVGPAAVIIGEDPARAHRIRRHAALLGRLPQRRRQRRLMAVSRPAGQPPGAAVVTPPGPALEQDRSAGHEREQSRRPEPAPVPVTELAADPAVPVPASHGARRAAP